MPGLIILRFSDFYRAHLAAHQFQLEGMRAEVLEYTLSTSPWFDGGFRLLVFEKTEFDEIEKLGPMEPGVVGAAIDKFLRMLAIAGAALVPIFFFCAILAYQPEVDPRAFITLVIYLPIFAGGAVASVVAYESFRNEKLLGKLVILGAGWCAFLAYSPVLDLSLWWIWRLGN